MFEITATECRDITSAAKAQPINEHLFDNTDLSIITYCLEEQIRASAYCGFNSIAVTVRCIDAKTATDRFFAIRSKFFEEEECGHFIYYPSLLTKLNVTPVGLAEVIKRLFEQKLSAAGFDVCGEYFTDESCGFPIPSFKMTISW